MTGQGSDPIAVLLGTLRLGDEPTPAETQSAWRGLETAGLSALVDHEGCALWLYRRLKGAGALAVPQPHFTAWLSQRSRDQAARNLLVDARIDRLSEWLRQCGYPHVWLKGAARRAGAARYPYADARATNDVDLIVPQEVAQEVWEGLRRSGYEPAGPPGLTPPDHFHLVPLWSEDRVAVELHLSTSTQVSPEEAWRRATSSGVTVSRDGRTLAIPGATELLWHGMAHGLLHGTRGFRLRYLLDASVVLASGEPVAWDTVAERLQSSEVPSRELSLAWLGAAASLAGCTLPPDLGGVAPFALGRALRWRLAVLRRSAGYPRAAEKLVEEGTRAEIGWPLLPGVPGTSAAVRLRRRSASLAARGVYQAWRML